MKTRIIAALCLVASFVFAPAVASAQNSGFALGMRAGYAVPFGDAGDGASLSDLAKGAVPVQVDVDYRLTNAWRMGVSLSFGPARVADAAKTALEAGGLREVGDHRQQVLAFQVARAFNTSGSFAPWVGVEGGYEWTRYAGGRLASGLETEVGRSGFTGAVLVGGDYAVSPRFTVGPYVAVDLGRYTQDLTWVENDGASSTDIRDRGLHQWVRAGIKATWIF